MTTTAVIAEAACALCGLPCREAAETTAAGASFCCAGCRNVYAILSESGLVQAGVDLRETEIFRRSLELGLVATPAAGRVAVATGPAGDPSRVVKELSFGLSGLWCTSCAWLIEHAVRRLPGVVDIGVSFSSDMATVTYAPVEIAPDRIRAAIERLGYGTRPAAEAAERRRREGQDALLRLGLAAFCWLNVMMLNMAVYVGYFERLPDSVARLMPFLLMVLSAPAVFYSAWPILRLAGHGLVTGLVRTETLLALGILCAWGYSVVAAVTRGPHIYFDTACAIVTLVLLGKWIERNARERARAAVTRLYSLLPNKARLYHDGHERFVAIDALRPGDEFLVKAGERIPADGRVIDGISHVDESMLTGEATPIQRVVGAVVAAGSINGGGVLRVRALRAAGESQISRIVALVEHALAARSTVERVADRFTRIFVPAVLVLAAATWGVSTAVFHLPAAEATMRAIAVLVIACPCALGIAAPLAITAAVGAASRAGILIGDSSVLETVNRVDVLVLDKTGTVTDGVVTLIEEPGAELAALAALEAHSEHPIGRAVVARARELGLRCPPVSDVEILGGRGIRGRVDGVLLSIGSRDLVGEVDKALEARAAVHEARGVSVAFHGRDGRAEGLLALGSRIRPGAAELVARVKERGIRTVLLSGDSPGATAWAAREIGADEARGGVRPEEKAQAVASLRRDGRVVAMVGDGVNDAPALAAADLGIAMGSGTDVAINAAAVTLTCNALPRVLDVFRLAQRTLRIVRQNLFWAFAYNVAGISLAATGTLHPIVAAGAMVVSSLCVILNSTRLNRLSAAR